MATLIKTQAIGTYSDYYLRLYIDETVNATANTSSVTVSLYGYTERAASICSWNNTGENSIDIVIDGSTYSLSGQNIDTADWRASGGHLLHSASKTVAHNADGTKTISVSGALKYKGGGSSLVAGTYSTGSVSQTLTRIARASTVSSVSGNTINSTSGNLTINLTKSNASYYDRIVTTGAVSTTVNVGQGTSGTIPWTSILDAMSSSASATLNITVRTYSNSSYTSLVASSTSSVTVSISTSAIKPTVSWGAISANSGGLSGNLVAGRSTAKATWTVTNARGASVSSVSVTADNATISSGSSSTSTSGTPVTSTLKATISANYTVTLRATVTDSRGATGTATVSKTVYLYRPPTVTLTAYRSANGSTTEDPAGTYVYIKYTTAVGASVNGANSISSTTTSPSGITSGTWRALAAADYLNVSVTATDAAGGSTTVSKQIPTARVPLSLYSNSDGTSVGVGIGGAAEAGKFKVVLPTYLNGNDVTPVGTTASAASSLTSVASGTNVNLCSMTLTKGTWIISAQTYWDGQANYVNEASISTASATLQNLDGGYTQFPSTTAATRVSANLSRILTVTSASQTVYLVAWHNAGSAKNTFAAARNCMHAVCVA